MDSGLLLSEFVTVDSGEPEGVTKKLFGDGDGGLESTFFKLVAVLLHKVIIIIMYQRGNITLRELGFTSNIVDKVSNSCRGDAAISHV